MVWPSSTSDGKHCFYTIHTTYFTKLRHTSHPSVLFLNLFSMSRALFLKYNTGSFCNDVSSTLTRGRGRGTTSVAHDQGETARAVPMLFIFVLLCGLVTAVGGETLGQRKGL